MLTESENKWREVLQNDPNNPDANYALGITFLQNNLRDAAIEYLKKAAFLAPGSANVHYNLAIAYFENGNILINSLDYANAMKEIEFALQITPNFKEAKAFKHFFIGRKLSNVDSNEASKEYQTAIDICPDIAIFYNNLGLIHLLKNRYSEAEKSLQKAIEIEPSNFLAFSNLCLLYYKNHNYKNGVEVGKKAIENIRLTSNSFNQAMAYNNFALCLWKTHKKQEAIEMITKAISLDPQNQLFRKNLHSIKSPSILTICIIILICGILCYLISLFSLNSTLIN